MKKFFRELAKRRPIKSFFYGFTKKGRTTKKRQNLLPNLKRKLSEPIQRYILLESEKERNKLGKVIDKIIGQELEKTFQVSKCSELQRQINTGQLKIKRKQAIKLIDKAEEIAGLLEEIERQMEKEITDMPRETPDYIKKNTILRETKHQYTGVMLSVKFQFINLAESLKKMIL